MSVHIDTIRRAAALMRELAEAAICRCGGPVCTIENGWFREGELRARFDDTPGDPVPHVLAWSPVVAVAAAIGLECAAEALEQRGVAARPDPAERAWMDLAHAFLEDRAA